eukprot:XP_001709736.1 Hypothetical protein GL50803_6265 [Giardia lamblia ATCC 50803]
MRVSTPLMSKGDDGLIDVVKNIADLRLHIKCQICREVNSICVNSDCAIHNMATTKKIAA